jgi:protein-S-isoprenylcysteine O-methyltransferase Ste14
MLVLRALFFALLMPGTVVIVIPWLLLRGQPSRDVRLDLPAVVGSALAIAGAATLLVCIRDFAVSGRGTLAPVDPPRKLVRVGLYRHVRNPMYLGVLLVLVGEALFFESPALGFYAAVLALTFHLFVVLVEEPSLRGSFPSDYERYRTGVPRWIPRLRPWEGRP